MAQIPEAESLVFDKLPLKDIDQEREGIERSPIASSFPSPNKHSSQSGMLSFSGMNSSRLNQCIDSPGNGNTSLDFSFLMNARLLQNTFACDTLSPYFLNPNAAPEPFYKAENN